MTDTATPPAAARPAPPPVTGVPLRLAGGRLSLLVHRRSVLVCLLLAAAGLAALAVAVSVGAFPIPLRDAAAAIVGDGPPMAELFVTGRRLPRALTALGVGLALGVAGAIFQQLTRNPLGSPDIVGFGHGAATGAIVVVIGLRGSSGAAALGALLGGVLAAAAVYLLAMRGGAHGYRLILVGIGVSAMLIAFNNFLVSRVDLRDARAATQWIVGSLYERRWPEAALIGVALLVLLPGALLLNRPLSALRVGEELAVGTGVRVDRVRPALVLVAVALTAAATACAGPVAFVALAAPQVARRLTTSSGPGLFAAGLLGAVMLLVSDILAQRLTAPGELPVGVVTAGVGGVYLAWLLLREWRAQRG
ncbi:ABC transporter permease [Pilimelia anulata]|uniref:ABC transporter permease n=1 Tax=Pilimelia anulata TaxID=53371 RepID=A0A8J3BA31_9ACTN|nr:iron chelate uptake ABC transporter family permease subunit [Pilimelia anulata]GGK04036.1 ABC transporter permease [Pilimelia anulata]